MSHDVTDAEIDQFLSGRFDPQTKRRVMRHLLSHSRTCPAGSIPYAPVLLDDDEAVPPEPASMDDCTYDQALERAFAAAGHHMARVMTERAWRDRFLEDVRSRRLSTFDEIVDALPQDMPGRVRLEALLTLSFEARYRDPQEMLRLARAAKIVAANLGKDADDEHGPYAATELADLLALATAELANAHRRNEDFHSAEGALVQALAWRDKGSSDPLLHARLMDVLASLRMDQRRLDEALGLLDRVHALYLEIGQTHLAGRALISKGITVHYDQRPAEAVRILRMGLALLDPHQDPQLMAAGQYDLLNAMVKCGEYRSAKRLLFESRLRHTFSTQPLNLLKVDGLEGRICAGLGMLQKALRLLATTQEGFQQAGLDYEASLHGLEKAEVLLRLGRAEELERVAGEILETFRTLDVAPEALRAVRYLESAVRQKLATAGLVRQVVEFLQHLERNPYLHFAP